MKKLIFSIIFIVVFITLFIVSNLSISSSQRYNLSSQIQYNYYLLNTDKFVAELSCGIREDNFEYDGNSNNKLEYGLLKIIINSFTGYASKIDVLLNINNKNHPYTLEKNPFDDSFMCDIGCVKNDKIIKIQISSVNDAFYEFIDISSRWNVDYKKAHKKGFEVFNSFIKENNKLCECYLNVINNDEDTKFFWVFKVQTTQLKSKMVVIDVNTCEIVLKS